jgi:hypothetical protein
MEITIFGVSIMFKSNNLAIMLLISLLLVACRSETPAPTLTATIIPVNTSSPTPTSSQTPEPPTATVPTPTQTTTPTPEIRASGPDNFPSDVSPLTGLQVDDPSLLDRRPLSIKVQTFPRGQRPPYGVSLADLVFDYYQNNGLTRLHAVFYSQDAERVSPIRSARLFDRHPVRMYGSILAFGGADQRILNTLVNSDFASRLVLEGANNCPPMCRLDPNGFNYLTTNTAELSAYADENDIDNTRQNLNGMTFDPQIPSGGEAGQQLYTRYSISSYVRWDYDDTNGEYLRFQDTQEDTTGQSEGYAPLLDGLTNQQIAADNVLVLYVLHEYVFKSGNSEIVDIKLEGSGKGYAYRNGQRFEITWNRSAPDALVTFSLSEGSLYPLKPGNTWFQIIGQSSTMQTVDGGALRFVSIIP